MKKTIKNIFIASLLLLSNGAWAQAKPCKEVIGYWCDWLTTTVDYSKYTILNYAFVEPNTDGSIKTPADISKLTSLVSAAHSNNTKVLVSVGGWTWSDNFPTIAGNATSIAKFASECQRYVTTYGLDGIDIDWEYPGYADHKGTAADKVNYTKLMQAIRTAIGAKGTKLLTACYGSANAHMQNIEWAKITPIVDMINLMTYDFFGTWDKSTNHNSPLYQPAQGEPTFNVNSAFTRLTTTFGVPADMINIGAAFYGQAWGGATSLFGSATGPDPAGGAPLYSVIMANKSGFTDYWDDQAKVPYMINSSAQRFISYDNEKSIQLKGEYAVSKGAHGVIVWEISGDRIGTTNPLAAALKKGLCGGVGIDEKREQEVRFYPNPATDLVYVSIENGSSENNVSVYNSLGQLVISKQFNQSQFELDVKNLEHGIYFVSIANESGVISKKLVKE